MQGAGHLEVLDRIVEHDPAIDVVVMAACPTSEAAAEAIRRGAAEYLSKTLRISELSGRIRILRDVARRRQRENALNRVTEATYFDGMIGRSPALGDMCSRIRRIAPHYRTALITGETGTGKELVARTLHNLSPVSRGRFVALNCSAVVETLFESELFGHVRGAFTGATQDKMGLFEYADTGTILLDEIGDLPPCTQAKLLRLLQNHEVLRVGSLIPRRIDVRVIAATHRDLRQCIAAKTFREDLYYRLAMIEIAVPSLAERKQDLPLLITHYISMFSSQFGRKIRGVTRRVQILLARYNWPGNVRELENVVGYACMMTDSDIVDVHDLPEYLVNPHPPVAKVPPVRIDAQVSASLAEQEKLLVLDALMHAGGNQSMAARSLRIGRDAIRYKMKKHGLDGNPIRQAS
jgi:DNA-binding NtrC family response regulator